MPTNDLTVWIQGGLGNQLFQLNAGLIAARELGVGLTLATDSYLRDRKRGYELAPVVHDLRRERLLASLWRGSPYSNGSLRSQTARGRRDIVADIKSAEPGAVMVGFFQDQESVSAGTDLTRTRLEQYPMGRRARELKDLVSGRPAVHVRRGDYVTLPSAAATFGSLTLDFYNDAISRLGAEPHDCVYFSDDADYIRSAFGVPAEKVIGPRDVSSPLDTLVLMGHATDIVISNSSFSWWASELVSSRGGVVVAPTTWFHDRPTALSPSMPHWTLVQNEG